MDFGANLAPFSLPKSTKILPKIDPKMHQIFDRFLHRFFLHFGSILGPKLGPCWPHFPPKGGAPVGLRPLFCWVYVIFRFFGPPGPPPGPILARFWRVRGSILEVFGLHFGGFGAPFWTFLVGDGLVGLREAQRIISQPQLRRRVRTLGSLGFPSARPEQASHWTNTDNKYMKLKPLPRSTILNGFQGQSCSQKMDHEGTMTEHETTMNNLRN